MPVREERLGEVDNAARKTWRKEYLPGPTALLGTTICGAVAGVLARLRPTVEHDRVTLHRVLELHGETLLQQLCDYAGRTAPVPPKQSTSGRIFPIDMATIGQAYGCRRAVRSLEKASPGELRQAMDLLGIKGGASDMEKQVTFLLAIPILQPSTRYYGPSRVAGVLYVDSRSPGYWLEDDEVDKVCGVLRDSLKGLVLEFGRLRNFLPSAARENDTSSMPLRKEVEFALEALSAIDPPITPRAFQFNFDVSDLIPLEQPISAP